MLYMHACHAQHLLQVSACCNLLKCTFSRNYLWDGEGTLCAAFYNGPPMGHRALQHWTRLNMRAAMSFEHCDSLQIIGMLYTRS